MKDAKSQDALALLCQSDFPARVARAVRICLEIQNRKGAALAVPDFSNHDNNTRKTSKRCGTACAVAAR